MKSSFQPARLSFSVSDPLLLSSRATSSARRRMTAMFAGPLSLRLRAASSPNETSSCQCSLFSIPHTSCLQQRLRRQLARQYEDAHVGLDLTVIHPRRLDAAERREARKLVVFCKLFCLDNDGYTRFGAAVPAGFSLGHRGLLFPFQLVRLCQARTRIRQ